MIEADRKPLSQPKVATQDRRRRGAPLAMLLTVAAVWITGRAVLWENPYPVEDLLNQAGTLLADQGSGSSGQAPSAAIPDLVPSLGTEAAVAAPWTATGIVRGSGIGFGTQSIHDQRGFGRPTGFRHMGSEHHALWRAALTSDPRQVGWNGSGAGYSRAAGRADALSASDASAPFLPDLGGAGQSSRWSLDAWAFWREGSDAAPISQGRVPVYGASQAGAIFQYRFDPDNARDPRAYVRAYRALVDRPESEVAVGVSARPKPSIPVRVAAELRVTDNRFDTRVRPAAYAVTEIPPVDLPFDTRAEVYAGAGYVAGEGDTLFVDGQANVTRQVVRFGPEGRDAVKVSVGAGAWGGAQRDANRLDVGPTMRVDLSVGDVPARFSIDWRERVSGDASPISGLAATLSTSF